MIAGLTQKAGLPMPEVGIYDSARGQRLCHGTEQEPRARGSLHGTAAVDE